MRTRTLVITLDELQQALRDFAEKHAISQPETVEVESHGTVRMSIELAPGGLVECEQFRHRTSAGI